MKKITQITLGALLITSSVFTSCKKESGPQPKPVVNNTTLNTNGIHTYTLNLSVDTVGQYAEPTCDYYFYDVNGIKSSPNNLYYSNPKKIIINLNSGQSVTFAPYNGSMYVNNTLVIVNTQYTINY